MKNLLLKIAAVFGVFLLSLFPLVFPALAEVAVTEVLGPELVCCDPDNYAELARRADRARSLRWLSMTVIISGIIIAIVYCVLLWRLARTKVFTKIHNTLRTALSATLAIVLVLQCYLLVCMLTRFVMNTEEYYYSTAVFYDTVLIPDGSDIFLPYVPHRP